MESWENFKDVDSIKTQKVNDRFDSPYNHSFILESVFACR